MSWKYTKCSLFHDSKLDDKGKGQMWIKGSKTLNFEPFHKGLWFWILVMRFLLIHPWKGGFWKDSSVLMLWLNNMNSVHGIRTLSYYDLSMLQKNGLNIVHGFMNATFIYDGYEHRSWTIIVHSYIYEHRSLWTMIMAWGYEHRSLWSLLILVHAWMCCSCYEMLLIMYENCWSWLWTGIDHAW